MLKKAAMFGLDARVCLIIFITLGSIGFAQFYGSINKANSTQYITDMKSVIQAYKNFKNDTQYKLTKYSNPYYYNVSELVALAVDNNKPYTKKYSGPYLEYNTTGANNIIKNPILDTEVSIVSRSFSNDWVSQTHPDTSACSASDCFVWVVFSNVATEIANDIEQQVDGTKNPDEGFIRLKASGSNYDVFMAIEAE